jgi:nitric oxide reductase subunit C
MLFLVTAFLVQTWMVYTDPAGREAPPLSEPASRGWQLWHDSNCQSCHQLYGFGGFLGPDLTNAAPRLTEARLDAILTEGSTLMPPFGFDAGERAALLAFFTELDRTGVGQVRVPEHEPPRELLDGLLAGSESPDDPFTPQEQAGAALLFEQNCIDCHLPNPASAYRATDLTRVMEELGADRVTTALAKGVPGKAMPSFPFDEQQAEAVRAALTRLGRHGDGVRAAFQRNAGSAEDALLALPWFEYERNSDP